MGLFSKSLYDNVILDTRGNEKRVSVISIEIRYIGLNYVSSINFEEIYDDGYRASPNKNRNYLEVICKPMSEFLSAIERNFHSDWHDLADRFLEEQESTSDESLTWDHLGFDA